MDLKQFFSEYNKVAIAFSGGVDSAYLLYASKLYGADATAYYVKTQFQPQFEYDDAVKLANELDVELKVIELDVLQNDMVRKNDERRCYYCKNMIFSAIINSAKADGYFCVLDGTNASDNADDRPGMKALEELKVLSPLRLCNLDKQAIRELSKQANLFTWDKPAYACLATRIKPDEAITVDALNKVEKSEMYMMSLGFGAHRVRVSENHATIRVLDNQYDLLLKYKNDILSKLSPEFNSINFEKISPQ